MTKMVSTTRKRSFINFSIFSSSEEDMSMSSSVANSSSGEGEVDKENREPIYFGGKACQVKLKKLKYANTSIPVAVASTSTTPVIKSTTNADTSSIAGSITNTSSRAGTTRDTSSMSMTNSLSRDLKQPCLH